MRVDLSDVVGLLGALLVVAGVWNLWGWAWAALSLGVPLFGVYCYMEVRKATRAGGGS